MPEIHIEHAEDYYKLKLARAYDILGNLYNAVCGETGFANAVRQTSGIPYPWPALDSAEADAREFLATRPEELPDVQKFVSAVLQDDAPVASHDWAKLSELQEGDKVKIIGFTCVENGSLRDVKKTEDGDLYVDCEHGTHKLDGQIDDLTVEDELLGVVKVSD